MTDRAHRREDPEQRQPRRRQAPAARARAVAAQVHRLVEGDGPESACRSATSTCAPRSPSSRRLGALRLREDARLPLGHLPRAARRPNASTASATTSASRCGTRCPGEFRNMLRRLIVTQGDTEPASASSSSACSAQTAPSLYDLRNLFQVNVEEGRHLWAMVYLLHTLLRPRRPRGGRGAAAAPLAATPTSRASSARSTSRRATGCRSSCSRCSPTATASISSPRSPRAASIRSRAPAGSC